MDPNWFYSSLAQASAGVVGLIGGFTVTALLRQRGIAADRRAQTLIPMARNIRSWVRTVAQPRAAFASWYEAHFPEYLTEDPSDSVPVGVMPTLTEGNYQGDPTIPAHEFVRIRRVYADSVRLRRLLEGPRLDVILRGGRRDRDHVLTELKQIVLSQTEIEGAWNHDTVGHLSRGGEEQLKQLIGELSYYYAHLQAAENAAIPRSFLWSVVLLEVLVVIGILLPLGELSAHSNESRAFYLVAMVFALAGLVSFILWQFREVRSLIYVSPGALDAIE